MSAHKLMRVWNEGARGNWNYAYGCSCGMVERNFIMEHYASDGHAEHVDLVARIRRLRTLERLCRARSRAAYGTADALRLGKRWERVFIALCDESEE